MVKTDDGTSLPPATKPAESDGVGGREVLRPKAVRKVKSKQAVVTKAAVKSAAAVSEAASAEVSRFRRSGAPEPGSNRSSAINNTVKTNH